MYVSERKPESFKVNVRDGEDTIEFSYRIVAKRKGYEHTRLEHEPMGDDDPNLYPEKRALWKKAVQPPDPQRVQPPQEFENQR